MNSVTLSFWYRSIAPDPDKVMEIVFVLYTVNLTFSNERKKFNFLSWEYSVS
jgi:hypothetical protein